MKRRDFLSSVSALVLLPCVAIPKGFGFQTGGVVKRPRPYLMGETGGEISLPFTCSADAALFRSQLEMARAHVEMFRMSTNPTNDRE